MLITESPKELTFYCPKCGASNLRRRTFNVVMTERITVDDHGREYDVTDIQTETAGEEQYYCADCNALVIGVHNDEGMSEWIRSHAPQPSLL